MWALCSGHAEAEPDRWLLLDAVVPFGLKDREHAGRKWLHGSLL